MSVFQSNSWRAVIIEGIRHVKEAEEVRHIVVGFWRARAAMFARQLDAAVQKGLSPQANPNCHPRAATLRTMRRSRCRGKSHPKGVERLCTKLPVGRVR